MSPAHYDEGSNTMISPHITLAFSQRIIRELFREPRVRIFLIVAPSVLLILVRYLFGSAADFGNTGVLMVGVIPALSMCLIGSMTLVRERNRGTLEAVLATPASRMDLVAGYLCVAVIASFFQAICTVAVAYWVCGLSTASPPWLVGSLTMLSGLFGMSIGMCVSGVSKNEGEAAHFLPGAMVPQLLICGVFWPVSKMSGWVQQLERVLPMAAVTRSMTAAQKYSFGGASLAYSVAAMVGLTAGFLLLAATTIRRRTA
jgi:ABC-2 type transport system permease protein